MHQVLHHAMHHAMQAHLLFELFCRGDPLEQLRFGDEHGVELLARVLLVAPTALPLRRAFAQKLEHEELAVLRGREEVGLIVRDAQPRYRPTMDLRRCGEPNWSGVGDGRAWLRVSSLRGCMLVEPHRQELKAFVGFQRPRVDPECSRRHAGEQQPVRLRQLQLHDTSTICARGEGGRFRRSAREDALGAAVPLTDVRLVAHSAHAPPQDLPQNAVSAGGDYGHLGLRVRATHDCFILAALQDVVLDPLARL